MNSGISKNNRIILLLLACVLAFTCVFFVLPEGAEASSNKDFVIFLAPGHTPQPNFSRGGISEGQLNEQLSIQIGTALRSAGYTVYLTNKLKWESTDIPVIVKDGPTDSSGQYSYGYQILPAIHTPEKYGVNEQCDLVISVHHNAAYDSNGNDATASGIRFYYDSDYSVNTEYPHMNYGKDAQSVSYSKIAAEAMTNAAKNSVKYSSVKSVTDINGTGIKNSITRNASMASVLVEAGFMTNASELSEIRKTSNMKVLANSIVTAVNSIKDQIAQDGSGTGTVYIPGTKSGDKVTIDGVEYTAGADGGISNVTNGKMAVVYTMHNGTDKYTTYPTGMTVYRLKFSNGKYTATRQTSFDNILQYAGASIRITGKQGIRIISGIPTGSKDKLTSSGLDGYTMVEDGLLVSWADNLGSRDLTLSTCDAKATAYVKGSKNPVYSKANGVTYYTNTLTFTDMSKCKPDLVMRSYMKLKDTSGKEYVLYGGEITRSIYYIAKANKDTYKSGTDAYKYIWDIINYCEGTDAHPIMSTSGVTEATKNQMINFYINRAASKGDISSKNTSVSDRTRDAQGFPNYYKTVGVNSIADFVQIYIEEAKAEGVRADVAFVQAMDETGYLNYTGDVRINQFNFAGLGATGGGAAGATFADVRTGIRAQIQHLKAYASKASLVNPCVDPRFNLVTRGSAPNVEQLSGTWAANKNYGKDLVNMLTALAKESNAAPASLKTSSARSLSVSSSMFSANIQDISELDEIIQNSEVYSSESETADNGTEGIETGPENESSVMTENGDVVDEMQIDGSGSADSSGE